jgi:hypothetical protein
LTKINAAKKIKKGTKVTLDSIGDKIKNLIYHRLGGFCIPELFGLSTFHKTMTYNYT